MRISAMCLSLVLCTIILLGNHFNSYIGRRVDCGQAATDHAVNIATCFDQLRRHRDDEEFTPLLASTLHEVEQWQHGAVRHSEIEPQMLYLVAESLNNVTEAARIYATFPHENYNRVLVIDALANLVHVIQLLDGYTPVFNRPATHVAGLFFA